MCSERSSSFCTACDTRHVTHVTNPVISHEGGKDRIVITTNVTYPLSCFIKMFTLVKACLIIKSTSGIPKPSLYQFRVYD
jgi:hypothetical protein